MAQPQPRTTKDLARIAKELGYQKKEQIEQVVRGAGLAWPFDPALFRSYVAALVTHSHKARELLHTVERLEQPYRLPACPLCGAPTRRSAKWDGFFKRGDVRGWQCEQGGVGHFLLANMQPAFEKLAERRRRIEAAYTGLQAGRITLEEYEAEVYGCGTEICERSVRGSEFSKAAAQVAAAAD